MRRPNSFTLALAILVIPVQTSSPWNLEKYANIPAHTLNFSKEGLKIQVNASASPLMYQLPPATQIQSFKVIGEFQSLPHFVDGSKQGEKGADDYALRIGFIIPGNKQLTGIKRLLAPGWVKNLYDKIPPNMGLDHVQFFNMTQNSLQLNSRRQHPLSELIHEEFVAVLSKPGPFQLEYKLQAPTAALALWISTDGDDTQSKFELLLSHLELSVSR